jgi:hypothetical protein
MIYKISEDQIERVMKSVLDTMGIKVDIMYWKHSNHDNSITATVYLYKDGEIMGYRQGYEFFFDYDKRFDKLTPDGNYPKLQNLDFFKMIPEKVVIKYFTDRTKEYLRGYLDRGNIPAFKRIMTEETNTKSTNYQLQKKLIKSLLDGASFEGVCGYNFNFDSDDDRVSGVILKFSSQWYRSDDDKDALNTKLLTMHRTKVKVKEMVSKYLNIENLYVGSYLEDCEL